MPNNRYLASQKSLSDWGYGMAETDYAVKKIGLLFDDAIDEIHSYPTPKAKFEAALKFAGELVYHVMPDHENADQVIGFYDVFESQILPELPFDQWQLADAMVRRVMKYHEYENRPHPLPEDNEQHMKDITPQPEVLPPQPKLPRR